MPLDSKLTWQLRCDVTLFDTHLRNRNLVLKKKTKIKSLKMEVIEIPQNEQEDQTEPIMILDTEQEELGEF